MRLRRELIERIATVREARMQRQELTFREAAEMLGVSPVPKFGPKAVLVQKIGQVTR